MLKGQSTIQRRDFLSERYQCSRAKSGRGPIKVRVICKSAASAKRQPRATTYSLIDQKLEAVKVSMHVPSFRQSKRLKIKSNEIALPQSEAKHIQSNSTTKAKPHRETISKAKRAAEIIKRLDGVKKKNNDNVLKTAMKSERAQAVEAINIAKAKEVEASNKMRAALAKEASVYQFEQQVEEKQSMLTNLEKQISKSQGVLDNYRQQVRGQKELIRYYDQKKKGSSDDDLANFARLIEGSLSHLKGKHATTKAKILVDAVFNHNLLNGTVATLVKEKMRHYIRHLFRPWRIVKAGDVGAVGAFKSSTIDALRNVIDDKEEDLFPSISSVSRARSLLDKHGSEVIGWRREDTKYGEVFYLHFEKALRHLLRACNLHSIAEESSVKIALTVDGADLFKGRTHVSTGVKITDERGIHPISRRPLGIVNVDDDSIDFIKIQSQELCCVMIIADAVDSKHLYTDVLKEFYDWGNEIRLNGLPASEFGPKLQPFTVLYNNDLKGTWYLCNKGGGCKNKTYFCHLCPCTKHSLVSYKAGDDRCGRCKLKDRKKCYHHDICDQVNVAKLLSDLEAQLGSYYERHGKQFHEIRRRSKLQTSHMQANRETDNTHIDYVVPPGNDEKKKEFANFIARECILRGIRIEMSDNLEDWRSALRMSVAMENYVSFLEHVKHWNEQGLETVSLVQIIEFLIPCILHLENRVGEKIISCIVKKGLDLYDLGAKEQFLGVLSRAFQTKVFGTESSPSQWKLRYSSEGGSLSLEPIQLRNNNVRACLNSIDTIIEFSIINNEAISNKLIVATSKYNEAMLLLRKHGELSDEEIESFQTLIDDFFEMWLDIFGIHGVTNYIHMLGSGHIHYFLQKYRCLHLYSQQGWEALNGKIQTFIHQCSQRGGHNSGTRNGDKSYIYAVVRMVIRDLLWKTYEADSFYLDLERRGVKC